MYVDSLDALHMNSSHSMNLSLATNSSQPTLCLLGSSKLEVSCDILTHTDWGIFRLRLELQNAKENNFLMFGSIVENIKKNRIYF